MQIRIISFLVLLGLRWRKQISYLLFRSTDELVKDLWAIDDLGFITVERLGDLSRDKRLTSARRSIQKHALAVLHTILFNDVLRVASRVEGASKYLCKLLIQTTNSQLLEAHVLFEYLLRLV